MQSHIMRWIVPIIAGLIVVGIFLLWVMDQMQDLPIMRVDTSEENRFIRYMSCAVAMCSALHPTDGDACHDGDVMSQPLEYEGQSIVKGCRELCEEIRDTRGLPVQDRYCGDSVKFEFTFQEDVTYTANRTQDTNDLINVHRWKGVFMHREKCFDACPVALDYFPTYPWVKSREGYLHDYDIDTGDPPGDMCLNWPMFSCAAYADAGSIWMKHTADPNWVNDNCEVTGSWIYSRNVPIIDECVTPAGTIVEIWTENIEGGNFVGLCPFGYCLIMSCVMGSEYYACPQVIVSVV